MMFKRVRREKDFFSTNHGDRRIRGDGWGLGKMRVRRILSCLFACCFLLSASVVLADDSLWTKGVVDGTGMHYPADFNVFSFNKIEGISQYTTFHDIDGPMAAGDSLILKSFRLNHDSSTNHPIAAVVGGYVTFDNGGTVYGNVYYGTGYSAPPYQITYFPNPGQSTAGPLPGAPKSPIDFIQAHDDLTYYSDLLSCLTQTEGSQVIKGNGTIEFFCSSNKWVEVFEVDAEDLNNLTEIYISNTKIDPIILINVKGDHSVNIQYANILIAGANRSKILWNFPVVKEINITGTAFKGSLLAPWAGVEVKWGSFAGTLVANNVSGSAELYHWPFVGYEALQNKIENEVLIDPVNVVGIHLASEYDDFRGPTTVGIVTWSVDESIGTVESAEIRFGLTPTFGMVAPVDVTESSSYYRTLLLGMKPNSTYIFQVVVTTSGGTTYTSTCNIIDTGPLPPDIVTMDMTLDDRANRDPGFIISSAFGNDWAFIIDMDGDIVWWYHCVDASPLNQMCRATMSADGKYMWMVFNATKQDLGYLRKVRMDVLEKETFAVGASHDVTVVDENTIAYVCWNEVTGTGEVNSDLYPSVYEMETFDNGTTVTREIFETADVNGYVPWWDLPLDQAEDPHLNAIHYYPRVIRPDGLYYPKGLYSVGDRAFDIFVIDPSVESSDPDDKIVFRLTEVEGIDDYFPREQVNHGHQLLYDETGITGIVIFNNGGNIYNFPTTSYVVEYSLEYSETEEKWTGSLVRPWWEFRPSQILSDAQRLSNGNTLVTSSIPGIMVELDSDGNHVMELDVHKADGPNQAIGYSCWRPTLYGPPPY